MGFVRLGGGTKLDEVDNEKEESGKEKVGNA